MQLHVLATMNACSSVQVITFSSGEVGHGQNDFTKRVGFSATMPSANLSIYINNTQESDSGRYICTVIIRGSAGITGDVRLNVKGNGPQHQSHFKRLDLISQLARSLGADQFVKNHMCASCKHK